jgi:phytoene/squalene synthetase
MSMTSSSFWVVFLVLHGQAQNAIHVIGAACKQAADVGHNARMIVDLELKNAFCGFTVGG